MGVTVLPETADQSAKVAGGKQAFTSTPPNDWVRPTDWPLLPPILATDNKAVGLVAVTNDDANYLALNATIAGASSITFASSTSGSDSTDASTYTTASVTLTVGRTYLLSVENSHGSDASAVSSITSGTAGVPTFTSRATTQFNSNLNRVSLWTATSAATWTGTLTINFSGTTQTGACWSLVELTGVGNTVDDGIVQSVTATGSSGTASVTLATLATGSASFGVQAHASTAASTPGAGYTEIHDVTAATPAQALQTERLVTGSTTVNATFTSAAWGIIGVEFRRGSYTVDWGDGNTETIVTGTQANHNYTYSSLSTEVSSRGYKTALVSISGNGMWTTLNVVAAYTESGFGSISVTSPRWLDLAISGPCLTSFSIGNSLGTVTASLLQRCVLLSSSLTSFANLFSNCRNLVSASVATSATLTSTASMFSACSSLRTAPFFTTSSVTVMTSMFNGCASLIACPLYDTAAATTTTSMFAGCQSLLSVPALNTSAMTTAGSMFGSTQSLTAINITSFAAVTSAANQPGFSTSFGLSKLAAVGARFGFSISETQLSRSGLEDVMDNLGTASGAQTLTISTAPGAPAVISKTSSGTTSGSTTVTIANTSSLATGMEISGTGISDAVAVTFQDTGDTVTRTAHGIPNDTPVSFATVVTTTGIATYTRYYVVNATANTFQVSDTVGGSAKALTTDGSGTCLYGTTITSITANTSIELSIPASATGSVTTSSALLKRSKARLKGFTVSG